MAIGDKIRSIREGKGISVPVLSRKTGISDNQLREIEKGKRSNPTIETLTKIASALNVPVSSLVEEEKSDYIPLENTPHTPMEEIIQKTAFKVSEETIEQLRAEYLTFLPVKEELSRLVKKGKQMEEMEKEGLPPGAMKVSGTYTKKCPLISGNASCGKPFTITDNCIEDYVGYPDNIEADFAITAKGYSMVERGIIPGSICFVKKVQPSTGDIAAICIYENGDVYPVLKEIKFKNGTPEFFDGKGEKLYLSKDVEVDIIGKVVFVSTIPTNYK